MGAAGSAPAVATRAFNPGAFLAALETERVGRSIVWLRTVDSTMSEARFRVERRGAGIDGSAVVVADEQTAGRGREGRQWASPAGGLYATVVLRLASFDAALGLNLLAPVAVCRALEAVGVQQPRAKWPNDVWVGGRKISGMLVDAWEADGGHVALLGVGINVAELPPVDASADAAAAALVADATSVERQLKLQAAAAAAATASSADPFAKPDASAVPLVPAAAELSSSASALPLRERLLAALCNELERHVGDSRADILAAFVGYDMLLGRRLRIRPKNPDSLEPPFSAVALRYGSHGQLIVRKDGEQRESELMSGNFEIRPDE